MPSEKNKASVSTQRMSAVELYRNAFDRLKNNTPERLPKGSAVSQNNVAREAGSDPSALKKTRFPLLVSEIQKYVELHARNSPLSVRQMNLLARKKKRGLRERIEDVKKQRDHLASLLSEADATILELYDRIARLEIQLPDSNIRHIAPRSYKKNE
ncbi:MAG: hypothetical protein E6123_12545 [Clostridiales bacterium]|nr:hypothetical protein [Clostridiales bacterium]